MRFLQAVLVRLRYCSRQSHAAAMTPRRLQADRQFPCSAVRRACICVPQRNSSRRGEAASGAASPVGIFGSALPLPTALAAVRTCPSHLSGALLLPALPLATRPLLTGCSRENLNRSNAHHEGTSPLDALGPPLPTAWALLATEFAAQKSRNQGCTEVLNSGQFSTRELGGNRPHAHVHATVELTGHSALAPGPGSNVAKSQQHAAHVGLAGQPRLRATTSDRISVCRSARTLQPCWSDDPFAPSMAAQV